MHGIFLPMENNPQINETSRCAVIGHGSWATALVKVLTMNELSVGWFVHNPEVFESLQHESRNCRYLSDVEFDMSRIRLSNDVNETVNNAEIIFLVTPAAYLKRYLSSLTVSLKDKFVVSAIKGIITDEKQFVKLTYLTLACANIGKTRIVGDKLKTPFIKVSYVRNMRYLERSAVLKNIYAVLVGMALGLGYGDNFISVLVSNCIKEMYFLLSPQSINELTKFTPSIFFGDLLVSCYSSHSRNRQLGVLIGRGNTVKTALNEMTMVAEGYFASAMMPYLSEEQRAQLPIAETVYQVLHQDMPVRKAMKNLEDLLS